MTRVVLSAVFLGTLFLSGCVEKPEVDQCMRRELFQQCLRLVPQGPKSVGISDWADVVKQCEVASYYQSLVTKSSIAKQCQ